MKNHPYGTQFKDGKPVTAPKRERTDNKTPDPLHRNSVHFCNEETWCEACDAPHNPDFCVISLDLKANEEQENDEGE
jgi:hypothetical protein